MSQPTPRLDALLSRLRTYCDGGRGRRSALAQHLGIQPHMITSWLLRDKSPGGEYTLGIQAWLAEQGAV